MPRTLCAGTTWMDPTKSTAQYPQGPLGAGIHLPQGGMQPGGPLGEALVGGEGTPCGPGTRPAPRRAGRALQSTALDCVLRHPTSTANHASPAARPPLATVAHCLAPAADGMWTHATYWKGEFATGMLPQLEAAGNKDLLQTIRCVGAREDTTACRELLL